MRAGMPPGVLAALLAAALMAIAACNPPTERTATPAAPAAREGFAQVDHDRLVAAESEPGQWMSYGRTYHEQRFSPLDEIDVETVDELGLAWFADLNMNRPMETTPLFVDGVLYISTAWSRVKAFDARTGSLLWEYDPKVPGEWNVKLCCGEVNRGVAAWDGKIFVGALDGRLIALDAETGEEIWSVVTVDQDKPYSITGAPRVVKGLVLIGQAGAEFGVRGYISAYDVDTGALVWRFYTVPGDPELGFENPALEMAAETWSGRWWLNGGGGTVWDSFVYDPTTDLLYVGVGNGSPWSATARSPGGGDNLFLSSIVALDPDDGGYVWHFQTTPWEAWDFTATQPIIVADLEIDEETRHVLMQAPKNGFFYVLDAATGELISADAYAAMNWATGVDPETGRPIEVPGARYHVTGEPWNMLPGPAGAHAWHPMAFSPQTGLVYLPVHDQYFPFVPDPDYRPGDVGQNPGVDFGAPNDYYKEHPDAPRGITGYLMAWDPVQRREVWRTERSANVTGGALATAGGLVFHGDIENKEFAAYDAESGEKLWAMDAQTGVVAGAMSYELDGTQHIAIVVGTPQPGGYYAPSYARLLVFKLGGDALLPEPAPYVEIPINPPPQTASAEVIAHGEEIYANYCENCHGWGVQGRAIFPDLRRSAALRSQEVFDSIVLGGVLADNGMASFDEALDPADTEAVRAYAVSIAHEALVYAAIAAAREAEGDEDEDEGEGEDEAPAGDGVHANPPLAPDADEPDARADPIPAP